MGIYSHFIITRFNIKQSIWQSDKNGVEVNDLEWLQSRYELFKRFCFPSIEHQSTKNFKWLVYFDIDTPSNFKKENEVLREKLPNFYPKYVKDYNDFELSLKSHINEFLDHGSTYIITSRLDNDDCFHKNAVETIQRHFVEKDIVIIDLQNGITLQINGGYKLALKKSVISGPFISLIEKLKPEGENLTVYDREHTNWFHDAEFINVVKGFLWLQVVHDRNITNGLANELTFNKSYLIGYEFIKGVRFSFRYYIFIILKIIKAKF